ncbi:ABC transporter permease [soil metagenome]
MKRFAVPALALLVVVLIMWTLTATWLRNTSLVTPPALIAQMISDGPGFYLLHAGPTLERAGIGYLIGNVVALLIATIVIAAPGTERVIVPLTVVSQCIPITALGPVLLIVAGPQIAITTLAGLLVMFPTLVSAIVGGRSLARSIADVARVNGGSRRQVVTLRLHAATPSIASALVVGVPSAMLGAVLGEYFGGIQTGLGVALHAAQYQMANARMWSLAVTIVAVTLVAYGAAQLIERRVTRWSRLSGVRS